MAIVGIQSKFVIDLQHRRVGDKERIVYDGLNGAVDVVDSQKNLDFIDPVGPDVDEGQLSWDHAPQKRPQQFPDPQDLEILARPAILGVPILLQTHFCFSLSCLQRNLDDQNEIQNSVSDNDDQPHQVLGIGLHPDVQQTGQSVIPEHDHDEEDGARQKQREFACNEGIGQIPNIIELVFISALV